MNRYSRSSVSQFNPLSTQELFMVPIAKQQQHDATITKADELGLFDIKALSKDSELVDEYTSGYRKKLDELTDQVMSKGIDNMSKTKLRSLIKDKENWLSEGQGADIASNYSAYTTNKEDLDKMYQSGKITRDKYLRGLQQSLSNYKGVGENDSYNPFMAVQDVDFFGKAKEVASAISSNPTKITQFSGLQYNPTTGKYVDIKTNKEFTQKDAIRQAVRARLKMDGEIMSDINQRQQLGMLGNASVDEYIDGLGILNENIYAKNNRTSSKQYVGIDHTQKDGESNSSNLNPNYVLGSDRVFHKGVNSLSTRLDAVLSGKTKTSIMDTGTAFIPMGKDQKYTLNDIRGEEKTKYNTILNNLKREGVIDSSVSGSSKEAMQAVKSHLDKLSNFRYQPIILTEGLAHTYNGLDRKVKRTDPKHLAESISAQAERVRWMDPTKENAYNKFDDIPSKYKEDLREGKAIVTGVYSARNDLRKKYKGVPADLLTSAYEVMFSDGTKMLASRTDGERNQTSYRVDTQYNEIWNKTIDNVGFRTPVTLPELGQVEIKRPVEPYYDEELNKIVDLEIYKEGSKNPKDALKLTEDEFETRYKYVHGIK